MFGFLLYFSTNPVYHHANYISIVSVYSYYSMKYLGLDYGTKRIGVAISDDTGTLAFPLTTVVAGQRALQEVSDLARKHKGGVIVIGESRNFKNEPNLLMEDIEQFKKDIAELAQVPVVYEPEFMTSAAAAREGESKSLDASAAALILQGYLDRQGNRL